MFNEICVVRRNAKNTFAREVILDGIRNDTIPHLVEDVREFIRDLSVFDTENEKACVEELTQILNSKTWHISRHGDLIVEIPGIFID